MARTPLRVDLQSRRTLSRLLAWLVGALVVVPPLIQTIQAPKARPSVATVSQTGSVLAGRSQTLLFLLVGGTCLWIIAARWRSATTSRGWSLLVAVAGPAYLTFRDLYAGQGLNKDQIFICLIILAVWVLRPELEDLVVLGYLVGVVAISSIALGILLPSHALWLSADATVIDSDKAILPFGVLVGIFPNGNILGVCLVIWLPFAMLIRSRGWRWAIVGASLFALIWCASRGSFLALGLSAVTVAILHYTPRRGRRAVATAAALSTLVLVAALPWFTTDPLAFTNRGWIWAGSIDAWESSPAFGLGTNWFRIVGTTSGILGPAYHAHNQFLQALVTGGVVALLLLVWLLWLATNAAARLAVWRSSVPAAFVVALAASLVFEVPMSIDNMKTLPAWLLPLSAIIFTEHLNRPQPVSATRAERSFSAESARS